VCVNKREKEAEKSELCRSLSVCVLVSQVLYSKSTAVYGNNRHHNHGCASSYACEPLVDVELELAGPGRYLT